MSIMAQYPPGSNMQPAFQHAHPGMAPTPNPHMAQQMQMHPGVSGPPHVSQAGAMMGMQPGAVGGMPGANGMAGMGGQHPGAGMGMPGQGQMNPMHAMNQMAQQQHFLQQQQQQLQQQGQAANPQLQLQMQMRQQQMFMQRAQQMGINPQTLNGMSAGQMQQFLAAQQQQAQQSNAAAFQNNQQQQQQQQQQPGAVQLPPHLIAQQRQLQATQHAQQQQNAALMQQQMQMQAGNSQQSNPGQQPTPNPQGQPGHPGQMRPQSRMANPNEQNQPPQPQQQHPQQGQPGQPQQTQQGQPTPQSTPQQQQNLTPQQQQQQQQLQAQQQQQQQQAMQRQHQIALMQRRQLQQQQQMVQQQNNLQPQQVQGGRYILQLMNFSDKLGGYSCTEGDRDGRNIANWQDFVDRQFAPDGRLTLQLWDQPSRHIEMPRATLARFFWMYFETGASSLRLHTENHGEFPMADGKFRLNCQNATLTVAYPNGSRIELSGPMVVLFANSGTMIEGMEFLMNSCEEHLSRTEIEKHLANLSPTMSNQKSPKMTKTKLPKAQQKLQQQSEGLSIESFPKAPKSQSGMSLRMLQFLEISETMSIMNELIVFAHDKNLRPGVAIEQLNAEYDKQNTNPQIQLPPGQGQNGQQMMPNGMPMNNGTPRMANMPMPGFQASPAMQHMGLPNGSPHVGQQNLAPGQQGPGMGTPSPANTQMVAPSMVPQRSQQGTNSSAASANTSPQVNNKRRRSTVKLEGEDGGPEGGGGGQKVKPSPRMGKKAKPS